MSGEPKVNAVRRKATMRKILTVLAVMALLVVSIAPALANHRRPPRAILKAPHAWQKGELGTFCWSYSDKGSNGGTGMCADAIGYSWPDPDVTEAGARATIRLWAPKRPDKVVLDLWRMTDPDGNPVGSSTRPALTIRPHRKDGEVVAYDARFLLPETAGDVYMRAFVKWGAIRYPDGTAAGDALYDFHVEVE